MKKEDLEKTFEGISWADDGSMNKVPAAKFYVGLQVDIGSDDINPQFRDDKCFITFDQAKIYARGINLKTDFFPAVWEVSVKYCDFKEGEEFRMEDLRSISNNYDACLETWSGLVNKRKELDGGVLEQAHEKCSIQASDSTHKTENKKDLKF